MAGAWALLFGWLAVQRHLAGGSHAEDLGFTDQVLSNFLRGQWFRMSIYEGATWNTELDISRVHRPDSLLAFHFEPLLLLLVPLYALGGGPTALVVLQAVALAAGAVPAYRIGHRATGSAAAGLAVAAAYLLSPMGQWAALADFHTTTLAAPLLLLAVERLIVARSPPQGLAAAGVAALAREDVGFIVAALGGVLIISTAMRRTALALVSLGAASTVVAMLVIAAYSGGSSPFEVRYGATLGGGLESTLAALNRSSVRGYVQTVALSGGWSFMLAPVWLLPALPTLALNMLSTSPWMTAGAAHYSGLVLPFVAVGAAAGLGRLRHRRTILHLACATLALTSLAGYAREGAGPLGGNYAPAHVSEHAAMAAALADRLPLDAVVSASSSLVPRISHRPRVFVFPAVLDAEYVFVDLRASPAPTSAGDVFLRLEAMLGDGGWEVDAAEDGLVVLRRSLDAPSIDIASLSSVLNLPAEAAPPQASASTAGDSVSLLSATLLPSPDGARDVDGPRWILRTIWRANQALPPGTRVQFWLALSDGEQRRVWDIPSLWWHPPDRWQPGQPVAIEMSDVPIRQFASWHAVWSGT